MTKYQQPDSLEPGCRILFLFDVCHCPVFGFSPVREPYRHRRPFALRALDGYLSAVIMDDLSADSKPQTRSLGLGGEKEVEHPVPDVSRDPRAGIGDLEYDIPVFEQQLDIDLATLGSGLHGISEQVQKDLPDLVRIKIGCRRPQVEISRYRNAPLFDLPFMKLEHLLPQLPEVATVQRELHGPAVDQKLFDQLVEPLGLRKEGPRQFLMVRVFELPLEDLGDRTDPEERIFDLMCNACHHFPHGRKPFFTDKLGLERFDLGEVPIIHDHAFMPAARAVIVRARKSDRDICAVRRTELDLPVRSAVRLHECRRPRNTLRQAPPDHVLSLAAQNLGALKVDKRYPAVHAEKQDPARHVRKYALHEPYAPIRISIVLRKPLRLLFRPPRAFGGFLCPFREQVPEFFIGSFPAVVQSY